MGSRSNLTILGGGPAGLAVGYFARKKGLPFKIYEASDHVGGNAITLKHGEFRFDSGAHRFHDKDPQATHELMHLMGDRLLKIDSPSQIFHRGQFINFPLSPFNLMTKLGLGNFFKAGIQLLLARANSRKGNGSFETFATRMYGRTLADHFLLNYSKKLWGRPTDTLSPSISGKRLKGLDLATFLRETFFGRNNNSSHLEGSFYYPKDGYGSISERLAEACGFENIQMNSRITKILHKDGRIQSVVINGDERLQVDQVVNTLPLPLFLRLLEPEVDEHILSLAGELKFRNLIIVAIFLDQERVSSNASIYVPDLSVPFSRIYEPKNRSAFMAPPGKTSLCVELPCDPMDETWMADDDELTGLVRSHLFRLGIIRESAIIDQTVYRMSYAYPIMELNFELKVQRLYDYLSDFQNLKLSGRNGKFLYTAMYDMLRFGMDLVEQFSEN